VNRILAAKPEENKFMEGSTTCFGRIILKLT
jgi:hypothetical protein